MALGLSARSPSRMRQSSLAVLVVAGLLLRSSNKFEYFVIGPFLSPLQGTCASRPCHKPLPPQSGYLFGVDVAVERLNCDKSDHLQ
jgi:hypothetical protein